MMTRAIAVVVLLLAGLAGIAGPAGAPASARPRPAALPASPDPLVLPFALPASPDPLVLPFAPPASPDPLVLPFAPPASPDPLVLPFVPLVPRAPAGGFRWPLAGTPVVTRPFQPPPRPWLPGHRGVDLAGTPGGMVVAAGPGTVAFAGSVAGTGVVSIDHAGGLRTTYEPITPLVHAGDLVTAGQPIGVLLPGHAGCPLAACLHWGLRRGGDYLDPLVLLRAGRVRLYPVTGAV